MSIAFCATLWFPLWECLTFEVTKEYKAQKLHLAEIKRKQTFLLWFKYVGFLFTHNQMNEHSIVGFRVFTIDKRWSESIPSQDRIRKANPEIKREKRVLESLARTSRNIEMLKKRLTIFKTYLPTFFIQSIILLICGEGWW